MSAMNGTTPAAFYASEVLAGVGSAVGAASIVPVHHYIPIPPLTLIHALFVSHNTLLISKYYSTNFKKVNFATSLALNQLLLFGPLSVIAAMLSQPNPLLAAPEIIFTYGGVHFLNTVSGFADLLIKLCSVSGVGLLLDTAFLFVDAFARSDGIAMLGVEAVRGHPNPIISSSTWATLLVGWLVGVGSILMLGLISFEEPNWTLRTPLWLMEPSILLSSDIISSFLAAWSYTASTSPNGPERWSEAIKGVTAKSPFLSPLRPLVLPLVSGLLPVSAYLLSTLKIQKNVYATPHSRLLSSVEARTLSAVIIFSFSIGKRTQKAILTTIPTRSASDRVLTVENRKRTQGRSINERHTASNIKRK